MNIKEFYLNSTLNIILEEDKKRKVALRNWCDIIRDWSINEFVEYYNKPNVKPYFNAYAIEGLEQFITISINPFQLLPSY